jgi:hypothetical protein
MVPSQVVDKLDRALDLALDPALDLALDLALDFGWRSASALRYLHPF